MLGGPQGEPASCVGKKICHYRESNCGLPVSEIDTSQMELSELTVIDVENLYCLVPFLNIPVAIYSNRNELLITTDQTEIKICGVVVRYPVKYSRVTRSVSRTRIS
jgi:hypothetical protein